MSFISKIRRYITANLAALLWGAGGMLVLLVVLFGGEAAVSQTSFCVGCHSMTYPADEIKKSSHFRGPMGAQPECKDCHVPQGLANFHLAIATHIFDGARAIYSELADDYSTKKAFNKHRLRMAHKARMLMKEWDSLTCRTCHKNPRGAGKSAKKAHKKMETPGTTCIDCHQNLVHREAPETDLEASLEHRMMVLKSTEERQLVETLAAGCLNCHGPEGKGASAEIPKLACQKEEYLINQLKAFKAAAGDGGSATPGDRRPHDVMSAQAKDLNDAGMESLASFFSSRSCR